MLRAERQLKTLKAQCILSLIPVMFPHRNTLIDLVICSGVCWGGRSSVSGPSDRKTGKHIKGQKTDEHMQEHANIYCRKWLTGRSVWQRAVCQWACPHQCSHSAALQAGWCCPSLQTTHPASGPDPLNSWPGGHIQTNKWLDFHKDGFVSPLCRQKHLSDIRNWFSEGVIIHLERC